MTPNRTLDFKFRLLGFLPLIFFLAQVVHYFRVWELGNLMWMCNLGNLLLAIGLFTANRWLMRVAIIWTIPGLLIWFLYVVLAWGVFFSSTLAHVGGLVVGMIVLRRIGMAKWTWLYGFGWYLLVQLLSRLFTAPVLNVNLAHNIQRGWDNRFSTYWQFWIVLTLVIGVTLWLLELFLTKLFSIQGVELDSKVVLPQSASETHQSVLK